MYLRLILIHLLPREGLVMVTSQCVWNFGSGEIRTYRQSRRQLKVTWNKLKSQTHTQPEPGQYYCMLYKVFYLALVIFDFILASL